MASKEKLQQTWFEFLKESCFENNGVNGETAKKIYVDQCEHIHGYDKKDCNDFEISKLQKITAQRIIDYEDNVEKLSMEQLREKVSNDSKPLNLLQVIKKESTKNKIALAAEFKRASPSKGPINADLNAGEQATIYSDAGANVISILTETRGFMGKLEDLTNARKQTGKDSTNRPAILRKDFIISKYQILEARVAGADTILLVVAILPKSLLKDLISYSRDELNMEPLVEVHTTKELDVAIECGGKVIGVNNRNLHTFSLDLDTTDNIAHYLKHDMNINFDHRDDASSDYALCALSGMSTAHDVDRYRNIGVGMVLIGESLMRSNDPNEAIKSLCLHPDDYNNLTSITTTTAAYISGTKIIKVCGVTNPNDAVHACRQGANLIGIIFAKSKRTVTVEQGKEIVNAVRSFGEREKQIKFKNESDNMAPIQSLRKKSIIFEATVSKKPLVVGVFQNHSTEYINSIIRDVGIDIVQLHGSEGMEACNCKHYYNETPAIRVIDIPVSIDDSQSLEDTILSSITSDPIAILLDTTIKGGSGGGTGKTFDWNIVNKIQDKGLPVIIAGGLNPDNVSDAIMSVRPYGIDVSSGVEGSTPGVKDLEKVTMYVKNARDAATEANKGI